MVGFRLRDLFRGTRTNSFIHCFHAPAQLPRFFAACGWRQGGAIGQETLFRGFSVSRPANTLLRYAGTDRVADAFPAATQLERPLLRDQLEAAIHGLLEPFSLLRLSVPHRRIPLLQYFGICLIPIDDDP